MIGEVIAEALSKALMLTYGWLAPLFHIATLALILSLLFFGDKVARLFHGYFGINYFLIGFMQA